MSTGLLTVVKIGGGLLEEIGCLDVVLTEIAAASPDVALLIVPGGGPFADAVRDLDRRIGISDDAAHWMAVLAMDQYAHLIVARLPGGALVSDLIEIEAAHAAGRVPVLAPYRWLRADDPLPYSWDITSDSIAAWVAGVVGAEHLVLVKPPKASGDLVDRGFDRTLPAGVTAHVVPADQIDLLRSALRGERA